MTPPTDHAGLMKRALALASRGGGCVEPNPLVGCVLVKRGRIIGEGYHRSYGGAHAEVEALRRCGESARGCHAYVTLEPCSHFGKTPPCTSALIEAGVSRVYAAMRDPGAHVNGKGFRQLRRAGLEVECGLLEEEARLLNAPYLKLCRTGRPWVILKWAQSLDGKLAARSRTEATVSGPQPHRLMHQWRGRVDALVVGMGTVSSDDPLLTARRLRPRRVAARVVLDPRLRISLTSNLVRSAGDAPVLIVCSLEASRGRRRAPLERAGAEVLPMPTERGRIALSELLDELGRRRMTNVMVEGGGKVLGSFFDGHLADEARVFVSPVLVGGRDAPNALDGTGVQGWPSVLPPDQIRSRRCGRDTLHVIRFTEA